MVRFLAPQHDPRHGEESYGVTVLVRRADGQISPSTHWFKSEDDAWWFIERSCQQIRRANPTSRPEIVV